MSRLTAIFAAVIVLAGCGSTQFDAGCVIVNSSSGPTLTIGAADCFIDAQFV